MKQLTRVMAVSLLLFGVVATASAAEFISPANKGSSVSIPAGETHRNVYTVGSNVSVTADISGDLSAAGGTVIVNGRIGGDARIGGGDVTISAPIGGDLLLGSGTATLSSNSSVGGDLVAGGGMLVVDAPVNGKVWISGDDVTINSTVNGEVKVTATKSLTFGPRAVVNGKISYKGPQEAVVAEGAQVSTIEYTHQKKSAGAPVKRILTIGFLIQIAAIFIVAWVLKHFRERRVMMVMEMTSQSPLVSLGIGVVALIVTPFLTLLILITFVGYYLAILLFLSYLFLLGISCVLAAIYTGGMLMQWYSKSAQPELTWKSLVLGAVVYQLLSVIPFVGWLLVFILMIMAFGSVVRMLKVEKKTAEPVLT